MLRPFVIEDTPANFYEKFDRTLKAGEKITVAKHVNGKVYFLVGSSLEKTIALNVKERAVGTEAEFRRHGVEERWAYLEKARERLKETNEFMQSKNQEPDLLGNKELVQTAKQTIELLDGYIAIAEGGIKSSSDVIQIIKSSPEDRQKRVVTIVADESSRLFMRLDMVIDEKLGIQAVKRQYPGTIRDGRSGFQNKIAISTIICLQVRTFILAELHDFLLMTDEDKAMDERLKVVTTTPVLFAEWLGLLKDARDKMESEMKALSPIP